MIEDKLKKHLQDELALAGLTGSVSIENDAVVWRNAEGQIHREGGPAMKWASGTEFWYQNGKPHRADGPAIEFPNGIKCWFLNGEEVTEEEVMGQ